MLGSNTGPSASEESQWGGLLFFWECFSVSCNQVCRINDSSVGEGSNLEIAPWDQDRGALSQHAQDPGSVSTSQRNISEFATL